MDVGQLVALVGLVVDFLGATVIVVADVRGLRERVLAALGVLPGVDATYPRVYEGFQKVRRSKLTPADDEFRPVFEYLLAYPGEVVEGTPLVRPRTRDEHVHRRRMHDPGVTKLDDVRDHPLHLPLVLADPETVEIRLTDGGDAIVVDLGEHRGEFSRWHDTERFDDEVSDLFVRAGFLVLLVGFGTQIVAQTVVLLG